ncbi:tetratricopeptide repeat protein [bacterium]|nr:tetratricopeptide repeat protein [bacterium]
MSKKKRQQKENLHRSVPDKGKQSQKRFRIVVPLIIVLALAGFASRRFLFRDKQKEALLISISQLDLSKSEPQVADKITKNRQEVSDHLNSAEAWGKLAMNLDAHDFKKESIPVYKKASALDSSDVRWLYLGAMVLSQMGIAECLDWFDRAQKVKPDYAPLLVNYGDALLRFDKPDAALIKYRQALEQDSANSHALVGAAQIEFSKGDAQKARIYLEKAIQANPKHREAYSLMSTVCKQLKDPDCHDQTSPAVTELPEKTPMLDPIYAALNAEGESSLWHRFRGSEYMKKGLFDLAIQEFQEAMRIRPDTQTKEDLAKVFNSAGRFHEAKREYQSIIDTHPTPNNYFGLGLANARTGSYAEAENSFRKAIKLKPAFAEAHFNLAVVFAKTGLLKETIESLNDAIRVNPNYSEAHYHLGLAYIAANNENGVRQQYVALEKLDQKLAARLKNQMEQKATSIRTE